MDNNEEFSAVIIAAGYSSRMKEFKPLLKFGEKTAIELLVDTYLKCNVNDIIIVLGHKSEEVMEKLKHLKIKWVINENFKDGMYSSIKRGVKEIKNCANGFFLNPVDIPLIKVSTIKQLKLEFLKQRKSIIYPIFNGEKGHPPLISNEFIKIILEDECNKGLRYLLDLYEKETMELEVIDWGTVKDMDTLSDYEQLKKYFNSRNIPNEEECLAIWNRYKLPKNIVEHCMKVAEVGCNIGKTLLEKGYFIDLNKIKSAALLHDIARNEKKHDKVGAEIVRNLGYNDIATIIEEHMDIELNSNENLTEKEIVYLADKLVLEKYIVNLEQRFKKSMDKYGDNLEAMKKINLRLENCKAIVNKIISITGEEFHYE